MPPVHLENMKVALLADTHANLPALQTVLKDVRTEGITTIWHLGDFVGYGPFPNETINLLRQVGAVSVIGNYDRTVLSFESRKDRLRRKKTPSKYLAFRWAWQSLSSSNVEYLRSLDETLGLTVGAQRVLLTHGSPATIDEHLQTDTPKERLTELSELSDADVIACGHSHQAFTRLVDKVTFVNPGSVGRHEGYGGKASYAILRFFDDGLDVEHRLLSYDLDLTVKAIRAAGLPDSFAEVFRQGRKLDDIVDPGEQDTDTIQYLGGVRDAQIRAVRRLAERFDYERGHSHQVARIAVELFDESLSLHAMGDDERFLLYCAGLLHDIGWIDGGQSHHKASQRMILEATGLPFDDRQRAITACVARYHRKALPKRRHEPYGLLSDEDRRAVEQLGGVLRLADGLDRGHLSVIDRVYVRYTPDLLTVQCMASGSFDMEFAAAEKKKNLLENAFGRKVNIEIRLATCENNK